MLFFAGTKRHNRPSGAKVADTVALIGEGALFTLVSVLFSVTWQPLRKISDIE